MQYAIYLRKSRADMELELLGDYETLSRHETILLDLANRNHYLIGAIYKELVSGETIADRPVLQTLLHEVEQQKWQGILVMEIERLARGDTIDQGIIARTFKLSGTKIITPQKVYNPLDEYDEEYFEFSLYMSRREYKTISRRIQQGRLSSVREGKFIGSTPPFGYDRVRVESGKGYTLSPNQEANIVQLIFSLYTKETIPCESYSTSQIAAYLDHLHIKPRTNSHWSPSSIRDILKNPVYIGKIRWSYRKQITKLENGNTRKVRCITDDYLYTDGLHPPLIEDSIFQKACDKLSRRSHLSNSDCRTMKNPLAGLVLCEKCGATMARLSPTSKTPYATLYCPNKQCNTVSSPLGTVESTLIKVLTPLLSSYTIQLSPNQLTPDDGTSSTNQALLQEELHKVELQLDSLYELVESKLYSYELFQKRHSYLTNKKELLLTAIHQCSSSCYSRTSQQRTDDSNVSLLTYYYSLPCAKAKNTLLKLLLGKVEYSKEARCKKGDSQDHFSLTVYPRLPY